MVELAAFSCKRLLLRRQISHIVKEETLPVHEVEAAVRLLLAEPLLHHLTADTGGNARPRRARAEAHISLLRELLIVDLHRTEQTRECDDARPLTVVVEDGIGLLVPAQNGRGVRTAKVLEVEVELRKEPFCRLHKGINEVIVCLAAHTCVTVAEVERILQETLAVRPAVEHDRQNRGGIDPRRCRIHHEFSDGNIRPVRPPVADPENSLGIRRNDEPDGTPLCRRTQRLLNRLGMVDGEIRRLLRIDKLFAVLLDALGDHGIVDNRHELDDVLPEHVVKKTAIPIEYIHQETSLFDAGGLVLHLPIDACRLLLDRIDMRRQNSNQTMRCPFLLRKRRPFVPERIVQQFIPHFFHRNLHFHIKIHGLPPSSNGHNPSLFCLEYSTKEMILLPSRTTACGTLCSRRGAQDPTTYVIEPNFMVSFA